LGSVGGADFLLVGPPTLALNSKRCTVDGGECAVPGQDCTMADGLPCPAGATCQCRWVDQSRWKFVTAHEAGHMVQGRATGDTESNRYKWSCDVVGGCPGASDPNGALYDPPSAVPMCGCAHVDSANRDHCIQSVERVAAAHYEGFAHFFASRVYNDMTTPDECTFNYYKEGLLDECLDPTKYDCEPRSGKIKILPPFPVPCGTAKRWRNTQCGGLAGTTNDTTLAEMGTEQDWMQFLWSWNTRAPSNAPMLELQHAIRQACHPDTCIDDDGNRIAGCVPNAESCIDTTGARVPLCVPQKCGFVPAGQYDLVRFTWLPVAEPPPLPPMPTPEEIERRDDYLRARSYRDGVVGYYNAEIATADAAGNVTLREALVLRRDHFVTMALSHGVDENTAP
jgi:hypothetical protein